jgi:uncharacterized membrane protein
MRRRQAAPNESGLNKIIALLMVAGISAGVFLLIVGMVLYRRAHGGMGVSMEPAVFIHGQNLFSLLYDMLRGMPGTSVGGGILFMTLGIVVLMVTPLLRVVVSVVFFAWHRDYRYVAITLLVLVILTLSLMLH